MEGGDWHDWIGSIVWRTTRAVQRLGGWLVSGKPLEILKLAVAAVGLVKGVQALFLGT